MLVTVKSLGIDMQLKNNGVEFEVCDTRGRHLGDYILTRTGVIWCRGRTRRQNGIRRSWTEIMKLMEE